MPGAAAAESFTGVNCSVRPCARDSVNTRRVAPTSASRCRRKASAPRSRKRRARSFTTARESCGMRAAGVPGRAENGKTCRCVNPHCSTRSSELLNISSVSVGKPAIRSAPNTMSGRSRRSVSQNAMASRRACRRFMRLRMRSSPACSDKCRCGISRSSRAKASMRSRSASTESIDDRRSRFSSGHVLEDLLDQRAELRCARQVGAVARDVDAGEHDLAIIVGDEAPHILDHRAHRHRA